MTRPDLLWLSAAVNAPRAFPGKPGPRPTETPAPEQAPPVDPPPEWLRTLRAGKTSRR